MGRTERDLWSQLAEGKGAFEKNTPDYEIVEAMSEMVAKLDWRMALASKLSTEARKVMQETGEGVSLVVPTGFVSVDGDIKMDVAYGMIEIPTITTGPSRCSRITMTLGDIEVDKRLPTTVSLIGLTDNKVRQIVIDNPGSTSDLGLLVNGLVFHKQMRMPIENRAIKELSENTDAQVILKRMVFCLDRGPTMFNFDLDDLLVQNGLTPAVNGVGIYGEGVIQVKRGNGLSVVSSPVGIFYGMVGRDGVMSAMDERGNLTGNGLGILGKYSDGSYMNQGLLGEVDQILDLFDRGVEQQLALLMEWQKKTR